MKYCSAVLYDENCLIDLHKYGAIPIIESFVFWIEGYKHFYMYPGVRVTKGLVDEFYGLPQNDRFIKSLKNAIHKYETQKKLKGIFKSLTYLHCHFIDTMKISYAPGGSGYLRTFNHFHSVKE